MVGQQRLNLGEWRSGARRNYELGGFISTDTAVCADAEGLALDSAAEKGLAAPTDDGQWRAVGRSPNQACR